MSYSKMDVDTSFFFRSPGEERLSFTEDNVLIKQVPYQSAAVVLMNHPASVTLYKYVSIRVLSGSLSVLGYDITPDSRPLKVFSSEKTGLIEMKTEGFEEIWRKNDRLEKLEKELKDILENDKLAKKMLTMFTNNTVAVHITREPLPINVQYLEFYYPHVLNFDFTGGKSIHVKEMLCVPRDKIPHQLIQFGLDEERLANEINVLIRTARLNCDDAPRVIVFGLRNTGKSSLLRFLINKTLSVYPAACYLDTDPGQTEFAPPGVVSLLKITRPLMGPPFINQQKPTRMIFTGSISPSYLEMYSKSVLQLVQIYADENAQLKNLPLFVNTMGWMADTGLQCLINTIAAVKPTVLVEIVSADETSMFDYREYMPEGCRYFQLCRSSIVKSSISSKLMRELSLLSHLGKSQFDCEPPKLLNEFTPMSVSWKKLPIFIYPGKSVPPSRLVESVNQSIVALCNVRESSILESDIQEYQVTLEDDADNICLAYGFVKAVDELKQLLYIVSPLKETAWKDVNAIIKGDVMVPNPVLLNQEVYDVPLPFISERLLFSSDDEDEDDMQDTSMVSLNRSIEGEMLTDLMAHSSVKRLRKPVPTRYRKQKH